MARATDRVEHQETRETLRRHRSLAVQTGDHILHAGTPLDDNARAALNAIRAASLGH